MQLHRPGVSPNACAAATENGRIAVKRSVMLLLAAFVVFLGGCAEAFIPNGGAGYTVNVTPASATLSGLTNQQFVASANDGSRPILQWTVNGIAGGNSAIGTISATGLYTAPEFPPAPNTITVSATDTVDTSKTGSSAVTLNNPIPQLNSVSPLVIPVGPFTLSLTGLHFAAGAIAFLGNTALTTTVVSSTQLTATGTASSTEVGNVNITVQNPAPGPIASGAISAQVKGSLINVQVS